MINCPKCNELIGEDATSCFNCRHVITPEELREIRRNNSRMLVQAERETLNTFRKNWITYSILVIVSLVVGFGLSILLAVTCRKIMNYSGFLYFMVQIIPYALPIITIIIGVKKRAFFCPYCDHPVHGLSLLHNHCSACGAELLK